uniref:PDZ domain-containing protein n=1 Tax=Rhabditophanes sp. KR3021 TaxID=114890 RepID=A0AC35UDK2_9BILA
MVVIKIQHETLADGVLIVGDQILQLNGANVEDNVHFVNLLRFAPPKVGLGIKHYLNRVLISKTDGGSLSIECLRRGNHIVDIDGVPVTDKDVAVRCLLTNFRLTNNMVTLVIERPDCKETRKWISSALEVRKTDPPSIKFSEDIAFIASRERLRIKGYARPEKSIYHKTPQLPKIGPVLFVKNVNEFVIASDDDGKTLKKVRK